MHKVTILLLLLCITNAKLFFERYITRYRQMSDMTLLDYFHDSSHNLIGLYANSFGFQLLGNYKNTTPTEITQLIYCQVDLDDLDNVYNPSFSHVLSNNTHPVIAVIVYTTNSQVVGGRSLLTTLVNTTVQTSSQSRAETYFFKSRTWKTTGYDSMYYRVDQLGNQQLVDSSGAATSYYTMTPVTGNKYDGFKDIKMYSFDSTIIIADNYKKSLVIVTQISAGSTSLVRNEILLTSKVQAISFALSDRKIIISYENNTVVLANTNPFMVTNSYTTTASAIRYTLYDVFTDSLILFSEVGQKVCLSQLAHLTGTQTAVICYQEAFIKSSQNATYLIHRNNISDMSWNIVYTFINCSTVARFLQGLFSSFCSSCASGCLTCSKTQYQCLSCQANYNLINNFCCSAGLVVSVAGSVKTCVSASVPGSSGNYSQKFVQAIQGAVKMVNKVPSVRSILLFVFSSMVSFDDMYLYYYHERDYGNATTAFLLKIRQLQNDKWQAFNLFLSGYFESIGSVQNFIKNNLDFYKNYSSQRFIDIQGNGQGLVINIWNFISTNLLASAAIFLAFKLFFRLSFKFKVSKLFRPYSFSLYFVYFISQGNTQALVFYFSSSFKLAFSSNMKNKLLLSATYIFGFFFLMFCICGYILLFNSLKKFLKYFLDNISKFQQMVIFLTLTVGVKNLLFGFVHSYFRELSEARLQCCLLLLIELFAMTCYIVFLNRKGFEFKLKVWLLVVLQMMRILFIILLIVQQEFRNSAETLKYCQAYLSPLLELYTKFTYFSIFVNFVLFFNETVIVWLINYFRKHIVRKTTKIVHIPTCLKKEQAQNNKLVELVRIDYLNNFPSKTGFESRAELKRESAKVKSQFRPIKREDVNRPNQIMYIKKDDNSKKVIFQEE